MYKLKTDKKDLYIETENGLYKVIKGWESINGWYWFAVEQDKENPNIFWGLVQGIEDEWGPWDIREFQGLPIWEIPKENLWFSGRRDKFEEPDFSKKILNENEDEKEDK